MLPIDIPEWMKILKAPELDMSGDVILLNINDIVPPWDTYTFTLNIQNPGRKKIVIRVKRDPIQKATIETQTEHIPKSDSAIDVAIQTEDEIIVVEPKEQTPLDSEHLNPVNSDEEDIPLNTPENFLSCAVAPCHLLVRPPVVRANTDLPKYMIRPFDASAIKLQSAKRRASTSIEEEQYLKRMRSV